MAKDEASSGQRFDEMRNMARLDEDRAYFCRRKKSKNRGGIARNPDDRGMELDAESL